MIEMKDILNTVICGDCLEVMRQLPDCSVDTLITDPPYGLKFMGKTWDYQVPSVGHFAEMLRVARPGAILLCFGGSRTWHRIACHIEDAGWQIRDTLFWLYGSGLPKSLDIGKDFDRRACMEKLTQELGRRPTKKEWDAAWKNFRKVVGKRTDRAATSKCDIRGGKLVGGDRPRIDLSDITGPTTEMAKAWDGWGTGLKPACEPIIAAMKPLDGTFIENAEKWGVAGMNIDGGRISHDEPSKTTTRKKNTGIGWNNTNCGLRENQTNIASANGKGRWPANVILDEEAAAMLDEQSGQLQSNSGNLKPLIGRTVNTYGQFAMKSGKGISDIGGASRFFYTAKADKTERDAGLRDAGIYGKYEGKLTLPRKNHHPTVKPLDLMVYLCRLTMTPAGGLILDPYAGSGTTLRAAEAVGRPFIGIEIAPEYCEIARRRVRFERDKLVLFNKSVPSV